MDWGTVVILAAITWLDGVRRVPADALVLRRALGGRWSVADAVDAAATWRLVAWWSPVTLALVIPSDGLPEADGRHDPTDEALVARLSGSRRALFALRVLGTLILVSIVFGVPAAAAHFGAWGFASSLALVVFLAIATGVVALFALRRSGRGWRRAVRMTAHLLSPFSAPRAAELVLQHAVAGAAPLMVARRLLGKASFAQWVRPRAYDTLYDGAEVRNSSALLALLGQSDLTAIVDSPPPQCDADERYCPRCARVYRAVTATCAECRGLRLVRLPDGTPPRIQ
jgi:hypothetical protein